MLGGSPGIISFEGPPELSCPDITPSASESASVEDSERPSTALLRKSLLLVSWEQSAYLMAAAAGSSKSETLVDPFPCLFRASDAFYGNYVEYNQKLGRRE